MLSLRGQGHFCYVHGIWFGPGSSVGIATELRAGRSGIESRWVQDFPPVQTDRGSHPASCKMGTRSFPGVKCGQGVLLTTHPLLVPPSGPHWACNGITLPLPFTCHLVGWNFNCSFCQRELCSMVLLIYLARLSVSLYQSLIEEELLIMYTVVVGWVIHAHRSYNPLNFTKALIRSHTVSNCRRYLVMKLTHSFAAAGTCNKDHRRLNRLPVPSSPPIATLVATLSYCSIARFSEFVDMYLQHNRNNYRGADKSLARPGRKQAAPVKRVMGRRID